MSEQKTILTIDDDPEILSLMEVFLGNEGFKVYTASDGKMGFDKAKEILPDLIITDVELPGIDGFTLCHQLRDEVSTRFIPVIMLTGSKTFPTDRILGLKIGADDYLLKTDFNKEELRVRIERLIRRTRESLSAQPLTGLPGGYSIELEATRRINIGEKFAIAYTDIDNFKAYNDCYGYLKGDQVIHLLGQLIMKTLKHMGTDNDFVGHIGGDDFIFITSIKAAELISKNLTNEFDSAIPLYYNENDRKGGFIETTDRNGHVCRFPMMSISVAVATNERREINHYAKLVDILSELKRYAKHGMPNRKGSVYVFDRRTDAEPRKM